MSKSKKAVRLKKEFDYLHRKVEQMEEERDEKGNRNWETKAIIKKHKKMKLKVKDELAQLENNDA